MANESPVEPNAITITATGFVVPDTSAGGGLEPSANGSHYVISPGAVQSAGAERPHLRLVVGD